MVRLLLLNITVVGVHEVNALEELNVVNEAHELVLAVAQKASEVNNAEGRVDQLECVCYDTHRHQSDARQKMLLLQLFQLVDVLGFLLDEARLLFRACFGQLLTDILQMLLVHQVWLREHVLDGRAGSLSVFTVLLSFVLILALIVVLVLLLATILATPLTTSAAAA